MRCRRRVARSDGGASAAASAGDGAATATAGGRGFGVGFGAASPGDAASGGGGGGGDETWELAAVLAQEVGEPHECKDAPAELADAYTAALEDEVFDSAEIVGEGVAPKYKYTTEAAEAGDAVGPALRKALMREARSLRLPDNPLDELIAALGGADKVAELTGRKMRLVYDRDGRAQAATPDTRVERT